MEALAARIAAFCLQKHYIKPDQIAWLQYGLMRRLMGMVTFLLLLPVGAFFDGWGSTFLFLLVFRFIRMRTGGYHAKTPEGCLLGSTFTMIVSLELAKRLHPVSNLIHNVRVRSIRPCSFLLKWRYGLTKFPIGTSRPQTNVSASLHCFVLDSASWDIAPVSRLNMCVLWKSWIAINRNERRNVNARSRNRYFQVKKCSSYLKPRWINAHRSF